MRNEVYERVSNALFSLTSGDAMREEIIRVVDFAGSVGEADGGVRQKAGVIPWVVSHVATS